MEYTRDKYTDNKLAEEFDLIVLLNDAHAKRGVKKGALGTLISSYTGNDKPVYASFADGASAVEEPLSLHEFRVLNVRRPHDLSLLTAYMKASRKK